MFKKINGVNVLFESKRRIGKNPLDFLRKNHIQNGQYVSLGYLMEEPLSTRTRYINVENDAKLAEYIEKFPNSKFSADFSAARQHEKYTDALNGKTKTGTFEIGPVHIMKLGRYNFQWKNSDAKNLEYEQKELPLIHAVRSQAGFASFDADNWFDENDWHVKKKPGGAKYKNREVYKYGGPSIYPYVEPEDMHSGLGWMPIGDAADFYEHENTHNISFRQVLHKSNMREYQLFYVQETDGVLEPFDQEAYYFLAEAFKRPKEIQEVVDDLLDEERQFIQNMEELSSRFDHKNFNWEKVLYFTGSFAGADVLTGKRKYEPFIWINDEVIKQTYPWLNPESLEDLLQKSIRISNKHLTDWRKTPQAWESKKVKDNNQINEGVDYKIDYDYKGDKMIDTGYNSKYDYVLINKTLAYIKCLTTEQMKKDLKDGELEHHIKDALKLQYGESMVLDGDEVLVKM